MKGRRHWKTWLPMLAALTFCGILIGVYAGPLEPPGPPGDPTMIPIDQVDPRIPIYGFMLPFTIEDPGSYYLAEEIITTGGGIIVHAHDVTIDLMGFKLEGGTGPGIDGYLSERTTVRNGTIRGWSGTGIRVSAKAVLTDLIVESNGGSGIDVGYGSRVTGCTVSNNSVHGIIVGNGCSVENCTASSNTENGIWLSGPLGALVSGCVVDYNGKNGIRIDGNSTILNNHIRGNDLNGTNGKAGIWVNGAHNRIEGNSIFDNNIGVDLDGSANILKGNVIMSNLTEYEINPSSVLNLFLIWDQTTPGDPGPWHNVSIH